MQTLWDKALCLLKNRIEPETFDRWIAIIRPLQGTDSRLTLEVPDTYTAKHIQDNFSEKVSASLLREH